MNSRQVFIQFNRIFFIIGMISLLSACNQPIRRIEPDNLFWPMPPAEPRIKYVQSIFTEDDIGREYNFREKLFGKDYLDSLARPYGVTCRNDKVIVSDIVIRRVLIFDRAAKKMFVVGREGAILVPAAAVQDSTGTVYVADSGGSKVVVYNADGTYQTAYMLKESKTVGIALNEKLGRLYVVDRTGHQVVVLGTDGTKLFAFGGKGSENGKFNFPAAVAVDKQNRVYVLDSGNFRVQVFTSEGDFLLKFGTVGDRPGMFANPKGIALDSDGHIYVTDAAFNNFQIFDQEGRVLLFVGEAGPEPGYFRLPAGISIDEHDRICVADQLNGRIEVFQYLKTKDNLVQP